MSLLTTEVDQEINDPGGSAYFLAPEICKGLSYKGKQSDIWALGINIYYICFGKLPFLANSIPELYSKIINQEPEYPQKEDPSLIDLIKRILEKVPNKRMVLQDIKAHPWITSKGIYNFSDEANNKITVENKEIESAFSKKNFYK